MGLGHENRELFNALSQGLRMTPEEWVEKSLQPIVQALIRKAIQEERERNIEIIKRYLSFDSQRAVSWHEVNDCIDAIREPSDSANNPGTSQVNK